MMFLMPRIRYLGKQKKNITNTKPMQSYAILIVEAWTGVKTAELRLLLLSGMSLKTRGGVKREERGEGREGRGGEERWETSQNFRT